VHTDAHDIIRVLNNRQHIRSAVFVRSTATVTVTVWLLLRRMSDALKFRNAV